MEEELKNGEVLSMSGRLNPLTASLSPLLRVNDYNQDCFQKNSLQSLSEGSSQDSAL